MGGGGGGSRGGNIAIGIAGAGSEERGGGTYSESRLMLDRHPLSPVRQKLI